MKTIRNQLCMAGMLSVLVACGGDYSGGTATGDGGGGTPGGNPRSMEEFHEQRVSQAINFCQTCHVPGGIADVEDGRDFMLSGLPGRQLADLRDSWERLGGNNPTSRILLMASGQETPHGGGAPWPQGSVMYGNVEILLKCFADPAQCPSLIAGGGTLPDLLPLLGSKHAQHEWARFCEDQPDNALLPPDPRSLIRPGANEGRAVFYNAYFEDCREALPEHKQHARTCGEYRQRRDEGLHFLKDVLPASAMSAEDFNNSWQVWGLSERPENFDELYTLRYGLNPAPFHNPYPLPGEDPNATNGGSGQLPQGLRQMRDESGQWTGRIGTAACFQCHGGSLGTANDGLLTLQNLGLGNSNFDVLMNSRDGAPWAGTPLSDLLPAALDVNSLFNIGIKQRGQNNAVGAFEFLITLLDLDSLGVNPNPLKTLVGASGVVDIAHPLAHTQDTPPWWNLGSRPRKFFDAGVSADSTRIIMAAGPGEFQMLLTLDGKAYRDHIEKYDQSLEAFFLSLESPPYPLPIDEALAEQGAVIFHGLNLWARPGNQDRPQPLGGNGSCASCHGVYSPRYVHDSTFLEDPVLEGVAGHISPLAVIGTDPARSDMLTPTLRERWGSTFWGFPEGADNYVAPEDKDPVTELADDMYPLALRPDGACGWEQDVIGYQAPPLYGVWATAPYFHNGSVPTLEQVLDSSQRPAIWQRQLQQEGPVKGFDLRMETAYDPVRVGWKHSVLSCADIPGSLLFNCNPLNNEAPSLIQSAENLIKGLVSWAGLLPLPDITPGAFDKRLVYDSRILGNGKQGHEFTDVLTEQERRAVIEYLKTL
jgi:mono/diheme cytochrome c family protein